MIRILVVDDHEFVRQGLERLIATWEGIEVAAAAADGAEAVSRYRTTRPDVVLMDLGMAGGDGVEATRRIVELDPGARIVVLTAFPDQELVERALSAGAAGYILKYAAAEDIERAVRVAAQGECPLDPKVAHMLMRGRSEEGPVKDLSTREREVLELVADGMPNKMIARRLGITERTVKGHLTSIYRQIGVTDRLQAALFARSGGGAPPAGGAPPPTHDSGSRGGPNGGW